MADSFPLLRCDEPHVVFQECPDEVALCFSFYGCPLRCDGCHSQVLWNTEGGRYLTMAAFSEYLQRYQGLISAVVFFGGEWQPKSLQALLIRTQQAGLKTCLYTGLNHVSRHLRPYLDFAKVGPWRQHKGGLADPNSNQRFYKVEDGRLTQDLSHRFYREGDTAAHASDPFISLTPIDTESQHAAA